MADFRHKGSDEHEFRRGLEELVRGHIDGCMSSSAAALASCSSASPDEDEDGASDLLMRRRRRSDLGVEDLAETSAAERRHSRILSRWAARQAEELITTIERRNRESELMALARLHTVSMLDASFLWETRRAAAQSTVERPVPTSRASSVLQRWRELEDEAAASARNRRSSSPESSSVTSDSSRGSHSEALQQLSSEVPIDSNYSEYIRSADGPLSSSSGRQDVQVDDANDRQSSIEQSPDAGENGDGERERVRQIVRGWMTETPIADAGLRLSPTTESQRSEWLGERERERVRLVREWVQLASEQRDARTGLREEQESEHSVSGNEGGPPENARRDLFRLRGRQARLDLIMRIVRERERELQSLSEHRAVSCFAHRNRIQSFLRSRFLRIGMRTEDERRPSVAARELGQLRRHPVSILREGFRFGQDSTIGVSASSQFGDIGNNDVDNFRNDASQSTRLQVSNDNSEQAANADSNETPLETEVHSQVQTETSMGNDNDWNNSAAQQDDWQEEEIEDRERNLQHPTVIRFSGWHNGNQEEYLGSWHENINQIWPHGATEVEDGQTNRPLDEHSNWNEDDSQASEANWENESSDQQSLPVRRVNRFIPPDDDNVYSTELRELLSRRSVSNLLHSGFRESLDQLIQSYVDRQGRESFDWDLERDIPNTDLSDEGQGQDMDDSFQEQQNSVTRSQHVPPSPPMPPPQPLWHSEFRHNWTRQGIQRSEMEWDVINDLRADMARLQQVMSHMQRMLETCMDMQLELQRAVRQEVSAALNRSFGDQGEEGEGSSVDGGKWAHVKKGICCICCDNQIDSLLYRCGHMCSCSKCATNLVEEKGRCPMCRAPIVEVIRAYFIM